MLKGGAGPCCSGLLLGLLSRPGVALPLGALVGLADGPQAEAGLRSEPIPRGQQLPGGAEV